MSRYDCTSYKFNILVYIPGKISRGKREMFTVLTGKNRFLCPT